MSEEIPDPKLHAEALPRIVDMDEHKESIMAMFEALAADMQIDGRESGFMVVNFINEEDNFVTGTYVPELWFVVRKVLDD